MPEFGDGNRCAACGAGQAVKVANTLLDRLDAHPAADTAPPQPSAAPAGLFTLDEQAAAAWIADMAAAHGGDGEAAGRLPEGCSLIGVGWSPRAHGEEPVIENLVTVACDSRIITGPGRIEFVHDPPGGRYMWLIRLEVPSRLVLGSWWEETRRVGTPDTSEGKAVAAVLREAVRGPTRC